ncbi:MAG: flagellar basal-body MS-ring/collar protein FliF [Pseudomonadota bacterium]
MAENERNFIQQFGQILKAVPPGRMVSFVITFAMVVGGFIAILLWVNRPDYQALFTNLDPADAARITEKLREKQVPFQLKEGGSAVLVPDEQVYQLRLELASEGIPRGQNVGFEIFDKVGFGTTEFVQKLKYQQALQGELARTITEFDSIAQARVHIVSPGDSLFAEAEKPSTASIVLRLVPGRALDQRNLQGIINLVARAVEGLKPENITVVDMAGGLLSKGHDDDIAGSLSKSQFEHRQKMERSIERRIQTMLEPIIGMNRVVARVSAELDFGQVSILEEKFDPDSIAVRSEQREKETSTAGGESASGSPDLQTSLVKGGNSMTAGGFKKENAVINYEMNKINKQVTGSVGDIKRLSAAVIIDGPYAQEKNPKGDTVQKFVPRSRPEMKTFEDIIKKAIGYNEERGDQVSVSNIPFALQEVEEVVAAEKGSSLLGYARKLTKPLVNVILIALFFLLAVRPFKKWMSQTGEYIQRAALPQGGAIPRIPNEMPQDSRTQAGREQLTNISSSQPDVAAEIIRSWIKEGR